MGRFLAVAFAMFVLFGTSAHSARADRIDDETRRIAKQLQCPVCSGAAVSDSPSELAGQMRNVIRTKLEAGENEQQIVAYFVERYGDSVLIEPPRRGIGLAVWLAPIGVLVAGAILLWRILKTWIRPRPATSLAAIGPQDAPRPSAAPYRNGTAHTEDPASISTVDRARAELDRFRREG